MKRFLEIFRAGNYPQGNITEEQVQQIAENYDPSFLEAPITFDHGFGGPAYGWIRELKAEGGRLLATFKDVTDSLKMMSATKQYKRHSVEIYNDLDGKGPYLKALSMLGASTPAVKGMEPIEFASFSENFPDDESKVIECEGEISPQHTALSQVVIAGLNSLGMQAEAFAEQIGEDQQVIDDLMYGEYDQQADPELVEQFSALFETLDAAETITEAGQQFREALEALGEAGAEEDPPATYTEAEVNERISRFEQRINDLEDQLDTTRSDANTFRDENERIRFERRRDEFTSFLDQHIKQTGKFPPKLKAPAIALFGHLDGLEAGDEDVKTPLQLFKDIIDGLPEIAFDEHARKPEVPQEFSNANELADAARQYMEQQRKLGKHISAAAAVTHVKKHQKTDE